MKEEMDEILKENDNKARVFTYAGTAMGGLGIGFTILSITEIVQKSKLERELEKELTTATKETPRAIEVRAQIEKKDLQIGTYSVLAAAMLVVGAVKYFVARHYYKCRELGYFG